MKTVLLRGPVLTQSGYGVHCRQLARWLLDLDVRGQIKLSVQVLPWGDTPYLLNGDLCNGLVGEMMKRSVPPSQTKYDVTFQVQLPNEWDPNLGVFNVGVTAAVETDRCNPAWVGACNRMGHVVVPSDHALRALKNSGGELTVPATVIPESFPDAFLGDETVPTLDLGLETPFNFLLFGQLTGNNPENDRKNLFYTIKWMCEALKDRKDTGIVIKTNMGRNTKIDRANVKNLLTQLLREVRPNGSPPVHLLHGTMTDNEVQSLLQDPKIKAMVSLTRGEGFGLPLLEAAACGLPIIATNWSAHTEFLNRGRWIQVDYRMADIHDTRVDANIFMKGLRWAQPLEEDFKRKLRKFHDSPSTPQGWAKELQPIIRNEYSHATIASLYNTMFAGAL